MNEFRKGDLIRKHGLPVISKILFVGPPGCGKTLAAELLAKQVSLPLVTVRLDTLVSSYLGETSANLRRIFEFADSTPCVLFLDEFDAVARSRSDENEHGELRRVVNSLLQLIDRFGGKGFLVAATNHEDKLDSAVWRRFDEIIFFDKPGDEEISQLLKMKLKNFPTTFAPPSKASQFLGFSHAEIERVCQNAIKATLLEGKRELSEPLLDYAITLEKTRREVVTRVSHNSIPGE
ncbi:AAA family ATPase [Caulobacter mirabilis]|uniref:AAA family ATPase n=1 Tax=Caulobacter mirabilis TaxID=69666 RepID=A0A2D2B3P5_9CAUL|nr:AAA family ATPase [Caulobacter mirabilis]